MRFDKCRKCGNEQQVSEYCKVCEQPIEFYCKNCDITTEEQIHLTCKLISMDYHLLQVPIKN